jgi:hypothetical protein
VATLKWNEEDPIPEIGEEFEFEGRVYFWLPCPCSYNCGRPTAYSTADGQISMFVTALLRGTDQGTSIDDFLVLFYGLRTFAEGDLAGDNLSMWREAKNQIEPTPGSVNKKFLNEKDIPEELYLKAIEEEEEIERSVGPTGTARISFRNLLRLLGIDPSSGDRSN